MKPSTYKACTNIYCVELRTLAAYADGFTECGTCGSRLAPISDKMEKDISKLRDVMEAMGEARKMEAKVFLREMLEPTEADIFHVKADSFAEELNSLSHSTLFQHWKDKRK